MHLFLILLLSLGSSIGLAGDDVDEKNSVVGYHPSNQNILVLSEWKLVSGPAGTKSLPMFLIELSKKQETKSFREIPLLAGKQRSEIGTAAYARAAEQKYKELAGTLQKLGYRFEKFPAIPFEQASAPQQKWATGKISFRLPDLKGVFTLTPELLPRKKNEILQERFSLSFSGDPSQVLLKEAHQTGVIHRSSLQGIYYVRDLQALVGLYDNTDQKNWEAGRDFWLVDTDFN